MKKICIAGKNTIAIEATKYLLGYYKSEELCVLINGTDNGANNWQPSFKKFAIENNIDIYYQEQVYEIDGLLLISLEYDKILPPDKFRSQQLFNIHFSLLPKYKGQFTSTWPILNLETESGVTFHRIDPGIDTGAIIDQVKFEIKENDTARDVYYNYLSNGLALFIANFEKVKNNTFTSYPQPAKGSTFYSIKSLNYGNVKINFRQTAYQVKAQIRAFSFREYQLPVIFESYVYGAEILQTATRVKPGTLLEETAEYLVCATIDYDIKIFKDYYYKFFQLCENGNSEELKEVLKFIPDLEEKNKGGWNGLMIAAYHGNIEVVKALVQNGANPEATNLNGTTVLMYAKSSATKNKDLSLMQWLVKNGADIDKPDFSGKDLLDYAKLENNEPVIEFISRIKKQQIIRN